MTCCGFKLGLCCDASIISCCMIHVGDDVSDVASWRCYTSGMFGMISVWSINVSLGYILVFVLDEWILYLAEFEVHLVGSAALLLISLSYKVCLDLNLPCLYLSQKVEYHSDWSACAASVVSDWSVVKCASSNSACTPMLTLFYLHIPYIRMLLGW